MTVNEGIFEKERRSSPSNQPYPHTIRERASERANERARERGRVRERRREREREKERERERERERETHRVVEAAADDLRAVVAELHVLDLLSVALDGAVLPRRVLRVAGARARVRVAQRLGLPKRHSVNPYEHTSEVSAPSAV